MCEWGERELFVAQNLEPFSFLIRTGRLALRQGPFYPYALALPVVIGLEWPLLFFVSLLLLAVVGKLEPSPAWPRSLVSSWVWAAYLRPPLTALVSWCRWLQTTTTWLWCRRSRCLSTPSTTQLGTTWPGCCGWRAPAPRYGTPPHPTPPHSCHCPLVHPLGSGMVFLFVPVHLVDESL